MRMKMARVLPLFLVLTLAFAAAGCLVPVEEARVNITLTPEELVEKMVEALRDVETYQIDMEMNMYVKSVLMERTIEMSALVHSAGKFDLINQRVMTTMIIETTTTVKPGVSGEPWERKMEMYWLDGMLYEKIPIMPGVPSIWTKEEMPWVSSLEQAIDLLKVSRIDILRVEEAHGVESYLIKVAPDLGKLWEILNEGMMLGPGGMIIDPEPKCTDVEEMFKDVSLKKWISRDTFLPVKDQIQTTMVVEETDLPEGMEMRMEMEMSMSSRYHSFNQPVTIQLPAEAAEAREEMPSPGLPPPHCHGNGLSFRIGLDLGVLKLRRQCSPPYS